MAASKTSNPPPIPPGRNFIILLVCLMGVMGALFHKSFLPGKVLFANDFPLGAASASAMKMPEQFTGVWTDLNWVGAAGGSAPADLSMLALWFGGPVFYAKFWQPLSLIFLGLSAWLFCRSLKFSAAACLLCGLAAALHSDYFSSACWGQVSRPVALGAMFLALAALQDRSGWRGWVRAGLAGMAVGLAIMEGFDVGALFSLVIGGYVIYQGWAVGDGAVVKRTLLGGLRLVVVVGFAAFFAAQALVSLIGTNITGVSGTGQDTQTKQEKWDWATQWSTPKMETLGSLIPGLFGYRMDTPDGGQYWGAAGRDPAWDRYFESNLQGTPPRGLLRYGGGGNYGGTLIPVVALWALLQSFRRENSPFSPPQRKFIWFWAALALVCLLLAWGRFALFYQFFYLLPYASTIRNPGKFTHIMDWAMLVMFAYGIHGLSGRLGASPTGVGRGLSEQWKTWRRSSPVFDRRWITGSVAAVGLGLLGWLVYAASAPELKKYLLKVQFDPTSSAAIASFSIRQVGWFVLFLIAALGAVALVLSGYFSGARARQGLLLLGLVLVLDLGRANLPWIIHWSYPQKYATNPVIERLRADAHEQRVAMLPDWIPDAFQISDQAKGMQQYLNQLYRIEWAQHHFLYYDIQSLDVVQMPRAPVDYVAFESALQPRSGDTLHLATRKWELTNTRYLIGLAGFTDLLNKQFDPGRGRFRVAETFNIVPKPGVDRPTKLEELTVTFTTNAPYALIEFAGALPRAKLYATWQVSTNDTDTLQTLASPAFDPAQSVLIAAADLAAPTTTTNQNPGRVEFKNYAPKRIVLEAKTEAPAVLLLNDRFAPHWQVRVDGKPETLLRCNYLMRGVYLTPGTHQVEFVYAPPVQALYVSLSAIGLGILLLGLLVGCRGKPAGEPVSR
jgi:hypothetical protein